jgi:hypothetical protein
VQDGEIFLHFIFIPIGDFFKLLDFLKPKAVEGGLKESHAPWNPRRTWLKHPSALAKMGKRPPTT